MNIGEFIEVNRQQMIEDISDLIAVPSVWDEATAGEGQPFGEDVARCLEEILAKAAAMGMEVKNVEGYAGEITISGRQTTAADTPLMIGVLAHEDVVPAGEGWDTDRLRRWFGTAGCMAAVLLTTKVRWWQGCTL